MKALADYDAAKREANLKQAVSKQALVREVATLYKAGWRTTQLVVHYRRSPATVAIWLNEAERLGLIPPRRRGRPKKIRRNDAAGKPARRTTGGEPTSPSG